MSTITVYQEHNPNGQTYMRPLHCTHHEALAGYLVNDFWTSPELDLLDNIKEDSDPTTIRNPIIRFDRTMIMSDDDIQDALQSARRNLPSINEG